MTHCLCNIQARYPRNLFHSRLVGARDLSYFFLCIRSPYESACVASLQPASTSINMSNIVSIPPFSVTTRVVHGVFYALIKIRWVVGCIMHAVAVGLCVGASAAPLHLSPVQSDAGGAWQSRGVPCGMEFPRPVCDRMR